MPAEAPGLPVWTEGTWGAVWEAGVWDADGGGPAPLTITTASLPNGYNGASYAQTLQATGGAGGNEWTVTGGALPNGLTLDVDGVLSGTPTLNGTYNFTVTVTDDAAATDDQAYTIVISAAPTATGEDLPVEITFNRFTAVTPSDATDHAFAFKALYIGGTGNVVVVKEDGTTVTFTGVPAGSTLRVSGKRVNSTNTTATAIVALGHI